MSKLTGLLFLALSIAITAQSQENYNLEERSNLPFPGKSCANIWGYVDSLNNEYALVGTSTGLSIVDVTDPESPILSFEVNGVNNFWREVKTWEGYAYVTTEGNNGGLTIVDLRSLPDTVYSRIYRGDGPINNQLSTIHALHIDNEFAYIYGSNIGEGGAIFLDLSDPWNPTYAGMYDERYVHDGIVWGDTLWASHIYDGFMGVIDVSNKLNPVTINEQETPNSFTHNTWLTDDRNTVLTTDEVSNSYLASYNINDANNIQELDRYQTASGSGTIVHNTLILNDYAVTSWYTEGVVIVDAHRPQNLIEVGKNDFTDFEGDGFNGCWGVYPYLPSGNIVASDIENGLYVLTPSYVRACYLEGLITDSICGNQLDNVTVSILELGISENTGFEGLYKTGSVYSGVYTVTFSKDGYETKTVEGVLLDHGELTELNISLFSNSIVGVSGLVQDLDSNPIQNVLVSISDANAAYQLISDSEGSYLKCDLLPGEYSLVAGQWGYVTSCTPGITFNSDFSSPVSILEVGYYDDFQFNFGWTVSGDATAGNWVRVLPNESTFQGAISNPGVDASGDCNGFAFVTGNSLGGGAGADDVDDGSTILRSPMMNLENYVNPYLSFSRWFFNAGGNDAVNDTLYFRLVEQNGNSITLKKVVQDGNASQWFEEEFRIRDFIINPSMVRFEVEAVDFANGHLVEAGIDLFSVRDSIQPVGISSSIDELGFFKVYPNPSVAGRVLNYQVEMKGQSLDNLMININDIAGKKISSSILSGNKGQIYLDEELKPGIYFVSLTQGGRHVESSRLVII
ncbi:MAG: choice-of-anchor B family protein [Bacteroidia bacterium]